MSTATGPYRSASKYGGHGRGLLRAPGPRRSSACPSATFWRSWAQRGRSRFRWLRLSWAAWSTIAATCSPPSACATCSIFRRRRGAGHPGARKRGGLLRAAGGLGGRGAYRFLRRLRTQSFDPRRAPPGLLAGAYKLKDGLLVMLDPERLDPMRLGARPAARANAAQERFVRRQTCEHSLSTTPAS